MAKSSLFFLLLLLCILRTTLSTPSDPSSDRPKTFIVHVSKSQKPALFSSHRHWYAAVLHSLPASTHSAKLLYTYNHAAHGFSAHLTDAQAAALHHVPGIISVVPERIRHVHTTHTPDFLGLSSSAGLWKKAAFYGEGIIIGVLDTGIWETHRSFSDSDLPPVPATWKGVCETGPEFAGCNKKLIGARAFYKGYELYLGKRMDESVESRSPKDTEGHGTHTASTAAGSRVTNSTFYGYASGEARGMASKARIAAYKICWSLGCFDSDILAAMDQATADGVDVISLSVGANGYAPDYYEDSIAIGAFGAAQKGILVSCSAGNSGPYAYSAVNIAPWILTVGASTVDRDFPADAVLGDGRIFTGTSLYSGEPLGDTKLGLVYAGDCGSRYCYMGRLDPEKVAGKIVLCDRGGNARVAKGSAVKAAGGAGMILANTEENGEELVADAHVLPATMVGEIAGDKIRLYVTYNSNPTATIVSLGTVMGNSVAAPKVAAFSSRGPNSLTAEILKPDVIAPGVNILAAWTGAASPTDLDIDPRRVEFNIISGTSMSCPHVSGLSAMLRSAYPNWSPAAIKSALMTTAYNLDNSGKNIKDLAGEEATPYVQGAGHVDPNNALDPGLVYDVNESDYVEFLCACGYNPKQLAVFVKAPAGLDVCSRKFSSPGDLNYPSFAVGFESGFDVVRYKRRVKNVGKSADAVYEVKVTAPENVQVSVSPSKLVFSAEHQELSYEVVFASVGLDWSGLGSPKFGSIEWSDGTHLVRSPIAVRWQQWFKASS